MNRGLLALALALACGMLAACTQPRDLFAVAPDQPDSFTFVAESYDLFPTRQAEGEARRIQDLEAYLASNRLCPDGYEIENRTDSVQEAPWPFSYFSGTIYRVTYRGRCRT